MTPAAERLQAELSRLDAQDRAEPAEFLLIRVDAKPDTALEAA